MHSERINDTLMAHQEVLAAVRSDEYLLQQVALIIDAIVKCFQAGNKVLLCGNGGSAADAQHIAAEWQGRYLLDRKPLFAEALHVNSSYVTAVANDYGYEQVYARAVEAQGRPGDILIGLSTSGNSPNICRALEKARSLGMVCIGFTGASRDTCLVASCDYTLHIPSTVTARIQEMHILLAHIICEETERLLFGDTAMGSAE